MIRDSKELATDAVMNLRSDKDPSIREKANQLTIRLKGN